MPRSSRQERTLSLIKDFMFKISTHTVVEEIIYKTHQMKQGKDIVEEFQ